MERKSPSNAYQLFMLVLCLGALLALGVEAVVSLDPSTHRILDLADTGICVLFFGDFLLSLARASNRWEYLYKWGWIDLASSVPSVGILRLGRVARIMRVFRVLRGVRATKIVAAFILDRRAEGAFLAATLISMLLVVFSSIAILHFEKDAAGANIQTPDDALWWAVVTVTTVGYGDRFPVTGEGRIVAAMLMIAGVGLFGTFSGFVAAWFLTPARQKAVGELEGLRTEIAELRGLLVRKAAPEAGHAERDGDESGQR